MEKMKLCVVPGMDRRTLLLLVGKLLGTSLKIMLLPSQQVGQSKNVYNMQREAL